MQNIMLGVETEKYWKTATKADRDKGGLAEKRTPG